MKIGGDYDSPEKQAIRERLWDPAIQDLVDNYGKEAHDLKFLDLPGSACLYLRQIIERFGVLKENIFAVEQFEEAHLAIHRFFAGRGVVRLGRIEDLCDSGELKKYFPIDIANLDFCGQGFIFPDLGKRTKDNLEYQRRWDCVKRTIDYNREQEKGVWYLLLTLACNRNNPVGREYLLAQFVELGEIAGKTKNVSGWKDNRLIQEVVPKIIAEEALQRDYIPSAATFESFRYVQENHSYQMVAWRIRFDLDATKSLGRNVTRRKYLLDEFCRAYFADDAKELIL